MLPGPYRNNLFVTLLCTCLLSLSAYSQSYRFRNYNTNDGIPNKFVYSIVQDDNGYLWIGTGSGLSKFDGLGFYSIGFPDNSKERYPTASLKDKNGNLWFGCQDGTVWICENSVLRQVPAGSQRAIVTMTEGPDRYLYVFPQVEAVLKINPDDPSDIKSFPLNPGMLVFSACFSGSGDLLIGTQENITIAGIENDSLAIKGAISEFDYASVTAIGRIGKTNTYLAGTNGNGIFRFTLAEGDTLLSPLMGSEEFESADVQYFAEDSEGNILAATNGSGAFFLSFSDNAELTRTRFFNTTTGLNGNNLKTLFQDMEGNYWFGMNGDGLSVLSSMAFSLYTAGNTPASNNIIYVNRISGNYLLGTPSGYWTFKSETGKTLSFEPLKQITENYEILSYCVDSENNIWIGTRGGGLYLREPSGRVSLFYRNGNTSEDNVIDVAADNRHIWLGTLNGVVILNREAKGEKFKARYDNYNGLPHNSISQIFLKEDGTAVIATIADRLYTIDPEKGVTEGKAVMYGTTRNEIISFCQTSDGHLWASTRGNGIFEFYNDSLRSYSRSEMLMSDYCYSIIADSLDRIWIGHDGGFSVFNRRTGSVRTFGNDYTQGGFCNVDGMFESPDGKVFIGTTSGFVLYDAKEDKQPHLPPINNINYVAINDSVYPPRSHYSLPYRKRYNISVGYVGINLKNPESVWYRTRLENYDDDWSDLTTEREARYIATDGRYRFMMSSVNDYGESEENPLMFEIFIRKPFWRTWWFIVSCVALVSGLIVLIVREREKAQKKIQAYLEKELEARTRVVVKQKEKIELQNIEITDSINYAKRIQTSILPDFARVTETFRDAFLLFKPRDIVSGDFYWFDDYSEDKFILVCADSTGHGVPGAFMSMIGSTLLQDIVTRQHITKPSEVLKLLDSQIFTTLNQNLELGVSNDGMDMVVCEVNMKKRYIRFASAMRPVILVLGGEPLYIKGNRCSVGGESVVEKFFDDQEYYLSEGDSLYLFSDGLPDQFGGTDGKKMKIARLKKLIEDVNNLPMSGQKEVIMKFYEEWKGSYDQVDDILMIGVRF